MEAVAAFGFTERQARFLLNVLLHSGVFVERQYFTVGGRRYRKRLGTTNLRTATR